MTLALTTLAAYLLGSIPFGVLIARAFGLGDLRAIGSGNIGATTVLRTGHGWLAQLLFAAVLLHLAAALFHAWVRKDGVFSSMAKGD